MFCKICCYYLIYCWFTHKTVLRLLRKLTDAHIYLTSLELLRVHLAATIFSDDVQSLLQRYKDKISSELNIKGLDPLLVYLSHFWELLQLNNSVTMIRICLQLYVMVITITNHHTHITIDSHHMVRGHWSWWCGDRYWEIQSKMDFQRIRCEYCSFGSNHQVK